MRRNAVRPHRHFGFPPSSKGELKGDLAAKQARKIFLAPQRREFKFLLKSRLKILPQQL
jgi:hypothetical protein